MTTLRHFTEPFNNMRTLKFKGQPTNAFFATVNQMFGGSSQLPTLLTELGSTMWFDYYALDSSRKLGGAAEHLIDGSEKRICRLTFEFKSPHVIERRSNNLALSSLKGRKKTWRFPVNQRKVDKSCFKVPLFARFRQV